MNDPTPDEISIAFDNVEITRERLEEGKPMLMFDRIATQGALNVLQAAFGDQKEAGIASSVARYAPDDGEGHDLAGSYPVVPAPDALRISPDELAAAKITPSCIVEDYLYADVVVLAGPGGTGKTTLALWEAVHIVLGSPLYGLPVHTRGAVVFVSAEDRRELLIARLSRIMEALELNAEERATVCARVMIWDVSGAVCRLTELDERGNVGLTGLADEIVERFGEARPVMVGFDPVISFGAGERLTNDNEQSLILAARRIVRGLGCCVRLICHTGKANARDRTLDQYSARGGSALSDGARMVTVLQAWEPSENAMTPPYGFVLANGETAFVLARPKLSFCAPQPNIWVKRRGYAFEHQMEVKQSAGEERTAYANQAEAFLVDQLKGGRYHSKTSLESEELNIPQKKLRSVINELLVSGRVFSADLPEARKHGGFKTYLHPACLPLNPVNGADGAAAQGTQSPEATPSVSTTPLPYRDEPPDGVVVRGVHPNVPAPRQSAVTGYDGVDGVGGEIPALHDSPDDRVEGSL